jgi:hypothetical protein
MDAEIGRRVGVQDLVRLVTSEIGYGAVTSFSSLRELETMDYGYHDVGGNEAGPISQGELRWDFWAKQSEAMRVILGDGSRRLVSLDELRRGFENFGEALYNRLGFYERRLVSMVNLLIEKEVFTREEIDARVAAIQLAREGD